MTVANQIGFAVTLAISLYLSGSSLLWAINKTESRPYIPFLGPRYCDVNFYGIHQDPSAKEIARLVAEEAGQW